MQNEFLFRMVSSDFMRSVIFVGQKSGTVFFETSLYLVVHLIALNLNTTYNKC